MRLRTRFMLPMLGVFVAAVLLGWWVGSQLLMRTLAARQQALIERTATLLAGGGFPLTPELLDRVAEMIGARILLLDADGRPVWPAGVATGTVPTPEPMPEPEPMPAIAAEAAAVTIAGAPYRVAVRPLAAGADRRFAAVAVLGPLADLRAAGRDAAWRLAAAALTAVFVLGWLAHRVAGGVTSPIEGLARMAARIAAGERDLDAPTGAAPAEIRALAGALNDMVRRLGAFEAEAARQARLAGLGAMAARVAHEVRNPLTAIKLHLQLLDEALAARPDLARQRATAATLIAEIRRLELLVGAIVEQGRPSPPRPVPTDVGAVAAEVCALFAPQFRHRGIVLTHDVEPGLPRLPLDPDRLRQMLMNLLLNARDAQPDGGAVAVQTRRDGDAVLLSVQDAGPGLSTARLAEVLAEPGPADGGGLGLRVTAELAAAAGGTLSAQPGQLGGAALALRFPLPGGR